MLLTWMTLVATAAPPCLTPRPLEEALGAPAEGPVDPALRSEELADGVATGVRHGPDDFDRTTEQLLLVQAADGTWRMWTAGHEGLFGGVSFKVEPATDVTGDGHPELWLARTESENTRPSTYSGARGSSTTEMLLVDRHGERVLATLPTASEDWERGPMGCTNGACEDPTLTEQASRELLCDACDDRPKASSVTRTIQLEGASLRIGPPENTPARKDELRDLGACPAGQFTWSEDRWVATKPETPTAP